MLGLLLLGCEDDAPTSNSNAIVGDGKVHVRVVDEAGAPLKGVRLSAIDDEAPRSEVTNKTTNSLGEAVFEDELLNDVVRLHGQDRIGIESILKDDTTFVLHPTPRKMRLVGSLLGGDSHIHRDKLISINSDGKYQCVEVDSAGFHNGIIVELEHDGEIASSSITNDHLWISVSYIGLDHYDISDPHHPRYIGSYPILMNSIRVIAANDSVLIISTYRYSKYSLDFYRVYDNGAIETLSRISTTSWISKARLQDNHLIVADRTGLITYDISDPRNPIQVASAVISFSGTAYFFENTVVFISRFGTSGESRYESFDITNPVAPVSLIRQTIPFDHIIEMASPTTMIMTGTFQHIYILEMDESFSCSVIASSVTESCTSARLPLIINGNSVWWVD